MYEIHLTEETLLMFHDPETQGCALEAVWELLYDRSPEWSRQYDPRGKRNDRYEHWTDEG